MLYIAVFSDGQGARRERGARLYIASAYRRPARAVRCLYISLQTEGPLGPPWTLKFRGKKGGAECGRGLICVCSGFRRLLQHTWIRTTEDIEESVQPTNQLTN